MSQNNKKSTNETKFKKRGSLKSGILGGVIGGLVVALLGGGYLYTMESDTPTNSTGIVDENGKVTTTDVSVNVTSEVTDAVAKVEDSVVSVVNMQEQNTEGFGGIFGSDSDGTNMSEDSSLQTAGEGSGVIYKIDGDTAYVVTNNHVINESDAVEVLMKDGTKVEAEIIGTDIWTDLAVLSIPSENVTKAATFGDSDSLTVGEPAIAIGSPLGTNFASSVTQGIISAKNRSVDTDINGDGVIDWEMTALQTDAAINPGNSGGALINIAGQVIGINSMKISTDTVEGMGFAIPSNDVVSIINQLETEGKVVRPVLGISLLDISQISEQQQASVLKLPKDVTAGVVVGQVQPDSAAEKGGLEQYDVIVKFNGEDVVDTISLRKEIYKTELGKEIEVEYYRNGKLEKTTITMTDTESIT
ncbi:MAG: trypsin-like peptidase domain-containing protein [Carnobacterium sp.]|uniref:S1C family serine protease n=1 Tax=Carnobacterium antarcticum TaxID=2126436 RepID=A0ABW4NLX1_9LACT|nr:trypsin-like peptidase domain-containing protein [Carnobacterium sp. CP1]ALV22377.1 Serine protease, DegP/HtrA [Carnobacterium sp. CP1]